MAIPQLTAQHHRSAWLQLYELVLLMAAIVAVVLMLPNRMWDVADTALILSLGPLATWRYGWWFTHFVRATIYGRLVFPRLKKRRDALWATGWRPPFVHFMVTTFKERPEITEAVLESIFSEIRATGVPARVFFPTAHHSDEQLIENYRSHVL